MQDVKWAAVKIDESAYSNHGPSSVHVVYMFDMNTITRICSQDKHYFLMPLYAQFNGQGIDPCEVERLEEDIAFNSDSDYFPKDWIDDLLKDDSLHVVWNGEEMSEEDMREHWIGNQPL